MKYPYPHLEKARPGSHLARGAWIEILCMGWNGKTRASHLARGAWIEIKMKYFVKLDIRSHLARGAWIEMFRSTWNWRLLRVAPRKRCVD